MKTLNALERLQSTVSGYQPGRCNISQQQRRRRYVVSIAAFLAAGIYVGVYLAGLLPRELLFGVFVPLAIGFEWFIEAHDAFCVRLALLNRYDFGSNGADERERVTDPQSQRADRVQAVKITAAGLTLAGVTTAVLVFLVG